MKIKVTGIGKKVEDAIADGLKKLDATIDDVDVKIVSQGGFFKKAEVELFMDDGKPEPKAEKPEPKTDKPKSAAQRIEQKPAREKPVKERHEKEKSVKSDAPAAPIREKSDAPAAPAREIKSDAPAASFGGKTVSPDARPVFERKKNYEDKPRKKIPASQEDADIAKNYIDGLLREMGVDGKAVVNSDDGLEIEIETSDSAVIGRHGETLDAIQYLVSVVLNEKGNRHLHISVDALGYRAGREENLKKMALRMAEKCVKTGRKVSLDSMSSRERRIVHSELSGYEGVITKSEGKDPMRRIVIVPARKV